MSNRHESPTFAMPEQEWTNPILFIDAFAQTKEQPLKVKTFTGKFFSSYLEISDKYKAKLATINSGLPHQVLMPEKTMDDSHYQHLADLKNNFRFGALSHIERLRYDLSNELTSFTERTIVPNLTSQQLEEEVLTSPDRYYRQKGGRTCYLANWGMVYTAITQELLNEDNLICAAKRSGVLRQNSTRSSDGSPSRHIDIAENTLLATFQTPAFKKAFPDIQVGVVKLVGADFDDITELTKKLRAKAENNGKSFEAYCITSIGSEQVKGGWHNTLLTSANTEIVLAHDPTPSCEEDENGNKILDYYGQYIRKGKKNRAFSKEDFARRWSETHLRSDYIFALKPQEK